MGISAQQIQYHYYVLLMLAGRRRHAQLRRVPRRSATVEGGRETDGGRPGRCVPGARPGRRRLHQSGRPAGHYHQVRLAVIAALSRRLRDAGSWRQSCPTVSLNV